MRIPLLPVMMRFEMILMAIVSTDASNDAVIRNVTLFIVSTVTVAIHLLSSKYRPARLQVFCAACAM